jgi:hypothetical protein
MWMTKMKAVAAVVLTLALLAGAGGALSSRMEASGTAEVGAEAPPGAPGGNPAPARRQS